MTINKSQGQTMKFVSVSHVQLYVALSIVSSDTKICIFVEGNKYKRLNKTFAKNVVYNEIFDSVNIKNSNLL